jgi:hypothetical protein
MTREVKQKLSDGAIVIGDELLARAEKDEYGLSLQTMGMTNDLEIYFRKKEDMYTGNAGIALFFLELHRHTQEKKYLEAAKEIIRWVEHFCRENPAHNYAFYTGRGGVAYVLLQFYHYTKDKNYLDSALKMMKNCRNEGDEMFMQVDVVNGIAGTILVLLHLHAATKEEQLLKDIVYFTEHLLKQAWIGESGIFWDRNPNQTKALCGFSHGSSGIGYVFLELGNYFNNKAFYWIAEEAIAYENSLFDEKLNNWPDYRKGIYNAQDLEINRNAYLSGNLNFFTKGKDFVAWCHGAPGIGLSRIRAAELTGKKKYNDDLQIAISKTAAYAEQASAGTGYIQCHGEGGNADLFLEAWKKSGNESELKLAENVALKALEQKEKNNAYASGYSAAGKLQDTSLFMGNAGVGYFYLRLLDPVNTRSLLFPSLEIPPDSNRKLSDYFSKDAYPADLIRRMLQKKFIVTITVAGKVIPEKLNEYFLNASKNKNVPFKKHFIEFMHSVLVSPSSNALKALQDIFLLELEKDEMDDSIASYALLSAIEQIYGEAADPLLKDKEFLLNNDLVIMEGVKIVQTNWNWTITEENSDWKNNISHPPGDEPFVLLLKPTAMGIEERQLNDFSYAVLQCFYNKRKVKEAVEDLLQNFGELSPEEKKEVTDSAELQIQEFIASGILLFELKKENSLT